MFALVNFDAHLVTDMAFVSHGVHFFKGFAQAEEFVHSRKIIHRDAGLNEFLQTCAAFNGRHRTNVDDLDMSLRA